MLCLWCHRFREDVLFAVHTRVAQQPQRNGSTSSAAFKRLWFRGVKTLALCKQEASLHIFDAFGRRSYRVINVLFLDCCVCDSVRWCVTVDRSYCNVVISLFWPALVCKQPLRLFKNHYVFLCLRDTFNLPSRLQQPSSNANENWQHSNLININIFGKYFNLLFFSLSVCFDWDVLWRFSSLILWWRSRS